MRHDLQIALGERGAVVLSQVCDDLIGGVRPPHGYQLLRLEEALDQPRARTGRSVAEHWHESRTRPCGTTRVAQRCEQISGERLRQGRALVPRLGSPAVEAAVHLRERAE